MPLAILKDSHGIKLRFLKTDSKSFKFKLSQNSNVKMCVKKVIKKGVPKLHFQKKIIIF